jgi:hypothetical protein
MQSLGDAFLTARGHADAGRDKQDGPAEEFTRGATWVLDILVPAVDRGKDELQPHGVSVHLDLNLDRRSTNHAHADFWFSETGGFQGPKYSINVLGGSEIRLYKAGEPTRTLGSTDRCGGEEIRSLLWDAASEFGRLVPQHAR